MWAGVGRPGQARHRRFGFAADLRNGAALRYQPADRSSLPQLYSSFRFPLSAGVAKLLPNRTKPPARPLVPLSPPV
jgi:hypothetical protein